MIGLIVVSGDRGRLQGLVMLNTPEVLIDTLPDWSFSFFNILVATLIAIDNVDYIIQFTCDFVHRWKVNEDFFREETFDFFLFVNFWAVCGFSQSCTDWGEWS